MNGAIWHAECSYQVCKTGGQEIKMDEERVEAKAMDAVQQIGDAAGGLATSTQANVRGVIEKGGAVARDLSAAGTRVAGQASEIIKSAANQAGDAASSLYRQGADAGGQVRRYAAEQPITALLIAAALGYGLAYLIHRR
jgi:ElaB/YqjD/DUF883 family membrane-anchored ribosome-binding protein